MCYESKKLSADDKNVAIKLECVSKCFYIYEKPHHRILKSLMRGKKSYGEEYWALNDASFEIEKGQTVGIIGSNGAGKSTLLQILAGTMAPTSGKVTVNGRVTALLELGAGFNPEFTGIENIYLTGAIYGLQKDEIDEKFDEIESFAEIGDFIRQPVKTYSSGMYVRLAFAIQASLEPDIFIVDEALAVGDAAFVHKCMRRFHQLKENGTTILLVTHDATAVRTLCERAIWLDKGVIRLDGEPKVVVDRYLADSRRQPVFEQKADNKKGDTQGSASPSINSGKNVENELLNIDQRYGDQACSLVGAGLYDVEKRKVNIVSNDSKIIVRVSYKNNSLPKDHPIIIGYSLRNHRGIDIASNNSELENTKIVSPDIGLIDTTAIVIELPLLHPGSYAFTISINYRDSDDSMNNADSISSLVVFDVSSDKIIHVMMSMKTVFMIDDFVCDNDKNES